MTIWKYLAAVAATVFCCQSAQAFDYKAHRDFSYQNPSGVWSYGGRNPETRVFTPLDVFTSDAVPGADDHHRGSLRVGTNTTGKAFNDPGSSTVVIPDNMLKLHPSDGEDVVVRFSVPADGNYRIQGFFQIMDTSPSGTLVYILRGNRSLNRDAFGRAKQPLNGRAAVRHETKARGGKIVSFDFTVNDLVQDEIITFGINPNGTSNFDSTGFDARITPAS